MVICRQLFLFAGLVLLISFGAVRHANAHQLQTDGTIAGVLHIEPDDDPVVGKPQSLDLYFSNASGKLDLSSCVCKLQLTQSGKTLYSGDLHVVNVVTSKNVYTFKTEGISTLKITGFPKQTTNFRPFVLTYQIRVERGIGMDNRHTNLSLVAGLAVLQLAVVFGLYKFFHP